MKKNQSKATPFKYPVCKACGTTSRVRVFVLAELKTMKCSCGNTGLEASVSWYGSTPGNGNGKPQVKPIHHNKDKAVKILNKLWEYKNTTGRVEKTGFVSFDAVRSEYEAVNKGKRASEYLRAYDHLCNCFEGQGLINLNAVATQHLKNAMTMLIDTEFKPGTKYTLNTVHQFIRKGRIVMTDSLLISNFAKAELTAVVTANIPSKKNRVIYNSDHKDKIFAALDQTLDWFRCYYKILWFTGIRRDHGIRLRWDELKEDSNGMYFETYPDKSKKEESILVDVCPELVEELKRWRDKSIKSAWIFPSIKKPNHPRCSSGSTVDRHINTLRKSTGLPGLNLHTLRHNFITRAFTEGRDARAIQQTIGHSTLDQTLKYANDRKQESLRRMRTSIAV